jgi:hypothetical protein
MRTNRIQGMWYILPDGPASCYRTLRTLLGSSCWELVLVRKIWKFSRRIRMKQMKKKGGRVGEALERVGPESLIDSGRPDSRKGRIIPSLTPPFGTGPAKAGVIMVTRPRSKALNTRPTDNYSSHF